MRLLILTSLATLAAAPALAAQPVEGTWLIQDQTAKVKIAPCPTHAEQLCGEIVWLRAPLDAAGQPKRDQHNPDDALKTRPLMGLTMIREFKANGDGKWNGGKIYDPRSGKTYNSKMQLKGPTELRVDGCVAMFCQGQTWRKVG